MGERRCAVEGLGVSPAADSHFWQGRRVLLTGHTGFKGSWAALWLKRAGAVVTGLALPPHTDPSLFALAGIANDLDHRVVDLRDPKAVADLVAESRPEIVLHLAAQAILLRGVSDPVETFASNVLGTVHLLEALRTAPDLTAVLVVTTDKVYENSGDGRAFKETDRLGGDDPYSASKSATEIAVHAYAKSYFGPRGIPLATARGGNVIGGGDFGEARLIPDLLRAVGGNELVTIRRPDAIRPWQHVLDCLSGYLAYAEALAERRSVPEALNFGPSMSEKISVREVAEAIFKRLGRPTEWRRDALAGAHDVERLMLDSTLAHRTLGWSNRLQNRDAIEWTAAWYEALAAKADMRAVTLAQIETYQALRSRTGTESRQEIAGAAT
jgi:CDP-glucose 4,6-dehydratase